MSSEQRYRVKGFIKPNASYTQNNTNGVGV